MLKRDNPSNVPAQSNIYWWLLATLWFALWQVFVSGVVWTDAAAILPGPLGDNSVMVWNLGWVKYALDHGNPGFWCPAAYYPEGFLFIYSTHTWLDGVLYWIVSPLLPKGIGGAILWANFTMMMATVGTGFLGISALRAWGIRNWAILLLASSAVTFCWFRMFAMMGHYHYFGTQWMMLTLCLLSWARVAFIDLDRRRRLWLWVAAGFAMGITSLNDQTMAIFAGILGGLVLLSLPGSYLPTRVKSILSGCIIVYGCALIPASIHLVPVLRAAFNGTVDFHVDKSIPRLMDASSYLVPNDYHLVGHHLIDFRKRTGLAWSEGTYLGVIPVLLFLMSLVGSLVYASGRNAALRICCYATLVACGFLVVGMGDRLMIGAETYWLLPGRLFKEIPLLNNMRVPQRWVWPAQICLALSGSSALSVWLQSRKKKSLFWVGAVIICLAAIAPLEGRSYPLAKPVDFHDPAVNPTDLVESVREKFNGGAVLTMPVEVTYAQADLLQFEWGYDIPVSVLYTARMPFTVYELPWDWNRWTPPAAQWLKRKQVTMIVFPFHDGSLDEFREWINEAKKAVPDLIVLNKHGQLQ